MSEEKPRRRLPVINAPPPDETPPEERAPHEWVIAAAITTVLAWLLLGGTANVVLQRVAPSSTLAVIGVNACALLLSSALAGALGGRFGVRAKRHHVLLGAALAAVFGWGLGVTRSDPNELRAWLLVLLVLVAIAFAGAALGYQVTRRA